MRLDAADLAVLELDLHKLGPMAHAVAQALIDQIRDQSFEVEAAECDLDDARDRAKDAKIALGHLRGYLTDAPYAADQKADVLEDILDELLSGLKS